MQNKYCHVIGHDKKILCTFSNDPVAITDARVLMMMLNNAGTGCAIYHDYNRGPLPYVHGPLENAQVVGWRRRTGSWPYSPYSPLMHRAFKRQDNARGAK